MALVPDANQRSQDVLTGGTIERIAPSEALQAQLQQGGKTALPQIYAQAGVWYNAVEALSDLIDAAPQDTSLRQQRAALFEQVGLTEAAAYDRQQK